MSLDETEVSRRWPRIISWPAVFVASGLGWLAIGALWGMLVGCRTTTPPMGPFDARPVSIEQALELPLVPRLLTMAVGPDDVSGNVRRMPASSACRPRGGDPLPWIQPQVFPPRAGQEWRCLFATSVLAPEPDVDLWIVLSTAPPATTLPVELSPIGMPGCLLQINPELLVHVPPGFAGEGILTRTPGRGRATLRWTPPAGSAGLRLWLQCMVASPGTPAGLVLSYAVELTIGS